jgi:putative colanic acid biosynthesis acetyltransferase WcaF
MTKVRLDLFDPHHKLDRGRPRLFEALWHVFRIIIFLSPWPWPSALKAAVLRMFGAKIGKNLVIKPRVHIHFPWKLSIGDHVWIGEETLFLNFESIQIGNHVCISQRAFICTGNHDYRDIKMSYCNKAITIEDGAWVGAQTFVAPGITIPNDTVVTAGSIVTQNLPPNYICSGNPCVPRKQRWL